jgi:hypothetical protein
MNGSWKDEREEEQVLLDRLVDGELNEAERREFLLRLEQSPDGWRRCAHAFLEAQSWRSELRTFAQDAVAETSDTVAAAHRPNRPLASSRHTRNWVTPAAMAASFLAAVGLGLLWRGAFDPDGSPHTTLRPPVQTGVDEPGIPMFTHVAAPQYGTATVSFPAGAEEGEAMEVPVVAGPGYDEAWLRRQPPVLPPQFVEWLQKQGHRVEYDRRYLPMPLQDGRQLVVPLDQVDIQFVGNRGYH